MTNEERSLEARAEVGGNRSEGLGLRRRWSASGQAPREQLLLPIPQY